MKTMNDRERIGARIAELRKQKGLSQSELSELTGYTQSNIARIEGGKYSVGIDVLSKVAEALGAKVEIIIQHRGTQVDIQP